MLKLKLLALVALVVALTLVGAVSVGWKWGPHGTKVAASQSSDVDPDGWTWDEGAA